MDSNLYTFDSYQQLAFRTSNRESEDRTTVSVLGLVGEAGEVVEMYKKHLGHGHQMDSEKLKKELGDVLWYIADLASCFDMNLADIAMANIEKLKKRYPERFTHERSLNRSE
jgi:NTP pyrophosphatase (non-canonical NTP hydrolase)